MANVIIQKSDGAQASVDEAEFKRHYPDVKYKVVGDEGTTAFELAGIETPKAARPAPRAKDAKRNGVKAEPLARLAPETPRPSEVVDAPVTEGEPG